MKLIGGETEHADDGLHTVLVDSGRSALRLILNSGLKNKKFLVPDYLCGIIPDILNAYKVTYAFYRVRPDLTVDWNKIRKECFDVLYVINYFGQKTPVPGPAVKGAMVIEDDVFAPVLEKPRHLKAWIGINSFRKISVLADGALVRSTVPLAMGKIKARQAGFVQPKYKAKQMKFEYLRHGRHSQQAYLKCFRSGEDMLDRQRTMHRISCKSSSLLLDLYLDLPREQEIRRQNYRILDRYLSRHSIVLNPRYFSFYVLSVEDRDALREFLCSHQIFLPAHWPAVRGMENPLYHRALSIPLDSRYGVKDMERIGRLTVRFLKKGT